MTKWLLVQHVLVGEIFQFFSGLIYSVILSTDLPHLKKRRSGNTREVGASNQVFSVTMASTFMFDVLFAFVSFRLCSSSLLVCF